MVIQFCLTEFVISIYKYRQNGAESFKRSIKAAGTAAETGNTIAEVGISSFSNIGIVFVVHILMKSAGGNYVRIRVIVIITLIFNKCGTNGDGGG